MRKIMTMLGLMALAVGALAQGKVKPAQAPKDDWRTLTAQQLDGECEKRAQIAAATYLNHEYTTIGERDLIAGIMRDVRAANDSNRMDLEAVERWTSAYVSFVVKLRQHRGVSGQEVAIAAREVMWRDCQDHPERQVREFFYRWPKG